MLKHKKGDHCFWIQSPNKRFLFLFFLLFYFFSCQEKKSWHTSSLFFFDTICEIQVFCPQSQLESAQKEVSRIFALTEQYFSPGREALSSPVVLDLFHIALQFYNDSSGYFDISIGPLSRLWGFSSKSFRVPEDDEIKKALNFVGLNKIKEEKGRLHLLPKMGVAWGGIAKGRAVELASQSLIKMGIGKGFINAGGDLFCWGKNPENSLWKIGIKHPRKKGYLGILSISNMAVSTSGDYQRFFERDGVRYHHIFNPFTGYPAEGKQSVTVIGPQPIFCDALSTALFAHPRPGDIIKKYPDYGAILVDSQGNISIKGKPFFFEPL